MFFFQGAGRPVLQGRVGKSAGVVVLLPLFGSVARAGTLSCDSPKHSERTREHNAHTHTHTHNANNRGPEGCANGSLPPIPQYKEISL